MMTEEIKNVTAEANQLVKQLQDYHEEHEKKQDVLVKNTEEKINTRLDELKDSIKEIEQKAEDARKLAARPQTTMIEKGFDAKSHAIEAMKDFMLDHKSGDAQRKSFAEFMPSYVEKKDLQVSVDADGGFLTGEAISQIITTRIFETSPIAQYANVVRGSEREYPIIRDGNEAGAGRRGEVNTTPLVTSTPQVGKQVIPASAYYAEPVLTAEMIKYAIVDIEGWLRDKVIDKISRLINDDSVNGDAAGLGLRGFLTYGAGTDINSQIEQLDSGVNGSVGSDADKLLELYSLLKRDYRPNAVYAMSRATEHQVRTLKDGDNRYIYSIADAVNPTLNGIPVVGFEDMPDPTKDSLSVAVADFKRAYTVYEVGAMDIIRDPYTRKPAVQFSFDKYVGGDVVNFEAIKIMKLAA